MMSMDFSLRLGTFLVSTALEKMLMLAMFQLGLEGVMISAVAERGRYDQGWRKG